MKTVTIGLLAEDVPSDESMSERINSIVYGNTAISNSSVMKYIDHLPQIKYLYIPIRSSDTININDEEYNNDMMNIVLLCTCFAHGNVVLFRSVLYSTSKVYISLLFSAILFYLMSCRDYIQDKKSYHKLYYMNSMLMMRDIIKYYKNIDDTLEMVRFISYEGSSDMIRTDTDMYVVCDLLCYMLSKIIDRIDFKLIDDHTMRNLIKISSVCSDMGNTNVRDTNVRDTNVRDTNIRDTNIRDTNVRDTNIRNTNIRNTNVRNTNVRNTLLEHYNDSKDDLDIRAIDTPDGYISF